MLWVIVQVLREVLLHKYFCQIYYYDCTILFQLYHTRVQSIMWKYFIYIGFINVRATKELIACYMSLHRTGASIRSIVTISHDTIGSSGFRTARLTFAIFYVGRPVEKSFLHVFLVGGFQRQSSFNSKPFSSRSELWSTQEVDFHRVDSLRISKRTCYRSNKKKDRLLVARGQAEAISRILYNDLVRFYVGSVTFADSK